MRKVLLPLMLVLPLFTGCASSYIVKLSNGKQITTASKPRLKGATYYFKDARGQIDSIPQSRVIEILPASMAQEEKGRFKPTSK